MWKIDTPNLSEAVLVSTITVHVFVFVFFTFLSSSTLILARYQNIVSKLGFFENQTTNHPSLVSKRKSRFTGLNFENNYLIWFKDKNTSSNPRGEYLYQQSRFYTQFDKLVTLSYDVLPALDQWQTSRVWGAQDRDWNNMWHLYP